MYTVMGVCVVYIQVYTVMGVCVVYIQVCAEVCGCQRVYLDMCKCSPPTLPVLGMLWVGPGLPSQFGGQRGWSGSRGQWTRAGAVVGGDATCFLAAVSL